MKMLITNFSSPSQVDSLYDNKLESTVPVWIFKIEWNCFITNFSSSSQVMATWIDFSTVWTDYIVNWVKFVFTVSSVLVVVDMLCVHPKKINFSGMWKYLVKFNL